MIKSEKHHWWPVGISKLWENEQKVVSWINPHGVVRTSPSKNFGAIGNGHHVTSGNGRESPWDTSFEHDFQVVDNNLPGIVRLMRKLTLPSLLGVFQPYDISDDEFSKTALAVISLAVRSPMNRAGAVSLAEYLRGPLPPDERKRLAAANMLHTFRGIVRHFKPSGKLVAVFSRGQEFIFGDGFYHNIRSPEGLPARPVVVVPLTPNLILIFMRPLAYNSLPRFFSYVASSEEVMMFNDAVQVYSKEMLFFRSQCPKLISDYLMGTHRIYISTQNPIDAFITRIPGVRDSYFHFS